jgi:hypothetical protein
VHLRPLGVYLLASLHYAAIFGKSPIGAAVPAGVSAAQAALLQQIAWDTYTSYRSTGTPWARSLAQCRQRIASELCPAYAVYRGAPGDVRGCSSWTSASSPFSDAIAAPLPAPL